MSNTTSMSFNSPEAVMKIVTQLNKVIDQHDQLAQSRMLPRREVVLPILIQLLDQDHQPCSETLQGVSLDISVSGIGFLCPIRDTNARFALIQFSESLGQHRPVVVELKNQTMLGPFCKMGGTFEVNWSESASQ